MIVLIVCLILLKLYRMRLLLIRQKEVWEKNLVATKFNSFLFFFVEKPYPEVCNIADNLWILYSMSRD